MPDTRITEEVEIWTFADRNESSSVESSIQSKKLIASKILSYFSTKQRFPGRPKINFEPNSLGKLQLWTYSKGELMFS